MSSSEFAIKISCSNLAVLFLLNVELCGARSLQMLSYMESISTKPHLHAWKYFE